MVDDMKCRLAAWLALIAFGPVAGAGAQDFEPGAGLQLLGAGATGVVDIGVVRFGDASVVLRALAHNGQVLQVHGRQAGIWLAKRSGSVGGKPLAPTTLDRLVALGGSDADVRCAARAVREEFTRVAAIVLLDAVAVCDAAARPARATAAEPRRREVVSPDGPVSGCGPIGCRLLYRHGQGPQSFSIRLDPDRQLWGFEGNGIVAIWGVPDR